MQTADPVGIAVEDVVTGGLGGLFSSNHEAAELNGGHMLIVELEWAAKVGETEDQHELGFFRGVLRTQFNRPAQGSIEQRNICFVRFLVGNRMFDVELGPEARE